MEPAPFKPQLQPEISLFVAQIGNDEKRQTFRLIVQRLREGGAFLQQDPDQPVSQRSAPKTTLLYSLLYGSRLAPYLSGTQMMKMDSETT